VDRLRDASPPFWWATAAGILLLGLVIVWAAGVLRVKTKDGVIVLENLPEHADVCVDGDKVTVRWPEGGVPAEITIPPGKHGVQVKLPGFTTFGEDVTILEGGRRGIRVHLERLPTERLAGKEQDVANQPTNSRPSATIDRARFTEFTGKWTVDGSELVQSDLTKWNCALMFGDEGWTDYDFTVDALRTGGRSAFSLYFRSAGRGDGFEYVVAGEGNKICHADVYEHGRARSLGKRFDFALEDHKWYTAHVHVRGNRFFCSLYDQESGTDVGRFDVEDDHHTKGRIGLGTWLSTYRFKNIRVTDPNGKVLWEGPPAVGSSTPPDLARLAEPQQKDEAVEGWVSLFNGEDLTGWVIDSGPKDSWQVEHGELVVTGPGDYRKSGFLLTDRDYSDFQLKFEFRPSAGANSGVAFWARPGVLVDGVPHHPQIELFDADKPTINNGSFIWSTSIGVRDILPPYRPIDLRPGGLWNAADLEVRGGILRVEINGREVFHSDLAKLSELPRAHPSLSRRSGRIGFQSGTGTVFFRNIEIKELNVRDHEDRYVDRDAFTPLFNGKTLTGWTAFSNSRKVDPSKVARVSGGEIILIPADGSGLRTERSYRNFTLKLEYLFPVGGILTWPGSGVIILPEFGDGLSYRGGIECQVKPGESGDLWANAGASLVGQERKGPSGEFGRVARKFDAERPPGEWNVVVIRCEDARITYELNGREVNRAESHLPISGWIGLMNQGSDVRFRNIEIKELPSGSPNSSSRPAQEGAKVTTRKGAARSPNSRRPADAREFQGKYYKLFPQQVSWHEASLRCQQMGGVLAVVTNEAQSRFLTRVVSENGLDAAWLGATDEQIEGRWVWVDGTPMRYSNWDPVGRQPNNKQGLEHYLVLWVSHDGKWCDQPTNSIELSPGFICQWN
jgi:hypothetical protein